MVCKGEDGTMTSERLDKIMCDMEETYAEWEEEEQRAVHEKYIMEKLRTIPPNNVYERAYQLLRLNYSDAYFQGHPLYCGEEWSPAIYSTLSEMLLPALLFGVVTHLNK